MDKKAKAQKRILARHQGEDPVAARSLVWVASLLVPTARKSTW